MKTCVLLCILILTYGCTVRQATYINHLPHDPGFEKGGEAVAAAATGLSGTDVQAAFSPVKFVGLTAGAYHGWTNRFSYNYGALVYAPVARLKSFRFFLSFHYEQTAGMMRGEMNSEANYTGINFRPSLYASGFFDDLDIKTGITWQRSYATYSRLFVNEKSIDINVLGLPEVKHNVAADARNIKFTGYGLCWFMEITDSKSRVSGNIYLGVMPGRYNYRVTGAEPMQNKDFRFRAGSFYAVSVKYRLQLY